jgi:hypothetical protein
MSARKLAYDWLKQERDAADDDTPLFEVEVLPSEFGKITKVKCIQVGPCTSKFAPLPGAAAMSEFDVRLTLIFVRRVAARDDPESYDSALEDVEVMAAEVARLLFGDSTMTGRVVDNETGDFPRMITQLDGHPHAIGNLQVFLNVIGQQVTR